MLKVVLIYVFFTWTWSAQADLKRLSAIINQTNCTKDQDTFIACIQAFDYMVKLVSPNMAISPVVTTSSDIRRENNPFFSMLRSPEIAANIVVESNSELVEFNQLSNLLNGQCHYFHPGQDQITTPDYQSFCTNYRQKITLRSAIKMNFLRLWKDFYETLQQHYETFPFELILSELSKLLDEMFHYDPVLLKSILIEVSNQYFAWKYSNFTRIESRERTNSILHHQVEADNLVELTNDIYLLKIPKLKSHACVQVLSQLETLPTNAKGLVIDLRNNTGGMDDEFKCIAALFLGEDIVIAQKKDFFRYVRSGNVQTIYSIAKQDRTFSNITSSFKEQVRPSAELLEKTTTIALVVLQNYFTTSFAEALSLALRSSSAHRFVVTAGSSSFGKGLGQKMFLNHSKISYLTNQGENFYLFLDSFEFFGPHREKILFSGIAPDISIAPFPGVLASDPTAVRFKDLWKGPFDNEQTQLGPTRLGLISKERMDCLSTLSKENYLTDAQDFQMGKAVQVFSCAGSF